jgi:protein-disulfide isomerase
MNSIPHVVSLAVPVQPDDHAQGSAQAPVTLIEYGDYECPSCKMALPTPVLLLERYPNKLRFIFRHFPLEKAHPHALLAAQAAEAAAAQGRFWDMHERLFQDQARLKAKDLERHAAEIGLDVVRYRGEMDDHIYLQKVREQIEGAVRSHIRATPTFFLDGVVQDVSFGMQSLHDAVAAAVAALG